MAKKEESKVLEIESLRSERFGLYVLGSTPLIYNRLSEKAKRELLLPAQANRASKRATLKHDPVEEFRRSVYTTDRSEATRLVFPSPAFKGAIAQAAIDLPGGASRAAIGRLCRVEGYSVPVWGVPQLFCAIVRQAGINKTPDVRTRAILPEWACKIVVSYVVPSLSADAVAKLVAAAGIIVGVGDFRQEKGKGDFGLFEVVDQSDERLQRVLAQGGREAQDEALEHPEAYDADTKELWGWFESEVGKRGAPRWAKENGHE